MTDAEELDKLRAAVRNLVTESVVQESGVWSKERAFYAVADLVLDAQGMPIERPATKPARHWGGGGPDEGTEPPVNDEHERAARVGRPGGDVEPAVLCWAAIDGGPQRCFLPLNEIDLVCSVHGKRRPPEDRPARREGWCDRCGAQLVEVDNPMRREFRHRRGTECGG